MRGKAGAELREEHEAVQPQDDLKNPALITWQVGPDLATLVHRRHYARA